MAARPYAKMITSVLESLTRRVDIFDERNRQPAPPAVCHTAQRSASCWSSSPATRALPARSTPTSSRLHLNSSPATQDKEIDIEAIGRKGRDLVAPPLSRRGCTTSRPTTTAARCRSAAERKGAVEVTGDHPGMLRQARRHARLRTGREHHLPLRPRGDRRRLHRLQRVQVGHLAARRRRTPAAHSSRSARRRSPAPSSRPRQRTRTRRRSRASAPASRSNPPTPREADEEAKKFGTAERRLHLRAAARGTLQRPAAAVHFLRCCITP